MNSYEIIRVENWRDAINRVRPGAMKIYHDETPSDAAALFHARVKVWPAVVFTWSDIRQVVIGSKLVTISAEMCGIPYTRAEYDAAKVMAL